MAAQSRLALRSAGLNEVPAGQNPSPVETRKRMRHESNECNTLDSPKKARNEPSTAHARGKLKTYARRSRSASIAAPALEKDVTQFAARTPTAPTTAVQQSPHESISSRSVNGRSNRHQRPGEAHETPSANNSDKRSLRSHDGGSRFKSELALYFADYDEILGDAPKAQAFLTTQTPIHIIDEPAKASTSAAIPSETAHNDGATQQKTPLRQASPAVANPAIDADKTPAIVELNRAERLDFSSEERHTRHITEDPLADELYLKAHRRAERGEKQHRNREKESAQHEQSQLERILEGLEGHAWLKTMGITGITDSEKKIYEPKRAIFVQRVTTLLNKFRAWKEEEKRRKAERERASTVDEEEEDSDGERNPSNTPPSLDGIDERGMAVRGDQANPGSKRYKRTQTRAAQDMSSGNRHFELLPPPPEKPLTSFFSKPHLREAALSKHRRGRLRFAFGHQIPDLERQDFELPAEMLTRDVLRAHARSRRAARRELRDHSKYHS